MHALFVWVIKLQQACCSVQIAIITFPIKRNSLLKDQFHNHVDVIRKRREFVQMKDRRISRQIRKSQQFRSLPFDMY